MVSASNLTKKYEMKKKSDQKIAENFWALKGVSFEVYAGESIGLIGTNGSGKSTLSNMIAGITMPTTGEILVVGKTSIVAVKSGLKSELTGRENIRLKCLLSGMSKKEIDESIEEIIAFAELEDFIDQPLKSYSTGMKSRLGFATSIYNDPDILIIDEALSVGDDIFYQKCVKKMLDFKEQGKVIFFVSHSLKQIHKVCNKTIWIQNGEMRQFGNTKEVTTAYKTYIEWYKALSKKEKSEYNKKRKINENISDLVVRQDFDKMAVTTKVLLCLITVLLFITAIIHIN